MTHKSKKGFTLVEIMIVVVIIGLLAAMAIPAFQKVRATSQEKTITNNLHQVASAAQQYMLEFGTDSVDATTLYPDYLTTPESVAQETYEMTVSAADTTITADAGVTNIGVDGIVTYTF
jgi:type IV pilus assembly protein PilA